MSTSLTKIRDSLIKHGSYGCVRANYEDALVIHEIFERQIYKSLEINSNDIVLDLGAHVGAFAVWACEQGAKKVVSVEPYPINYRLLVKNAKNFPIETIHAAVVGDGCKTTTLFVQGHSQSNTIVEARRPHGRDHRIEVPTISFDALLREYRPTKMKMDIEGGEYAIFLPDPPRAFRSVRRVIAELHIDTPAMHRDALRILRRMRKEFSVDTEHKPKKPSGWPIVRSWKRLR